MGYERDVRVGDDGAVESGCFFGLGVEPETGSDFWHCVGLDQQGGPGKERDLYDAVGEIG